NAPTEREIIPSEISSSEKVALLTILAPIHTPPVVITTAPADPARNVDAPIIPIVLNAVLSPTRMTGTSNPMLKLMNSPPPRVASPRSAIRQWRRQRTWSKTAVELFWNPPWIHQCLHLRQWLQRYSLRKRQCPPGEGEVGPDAKEERWRTGGVCGVGNEDEDEVGVRLFLSRTALALPICLTRAVSEEGGNLSIGEAVEVVEEVVSVEDEGSLEAVEEEEKEGRVVVDGRW
ncbi:hypothetical protein F5876DRAFT_70865, partial [Lentinula aff. lateritia]